MNKYLFFSALLVLASIAISCTKDDDLANPDSNSTSLVPTTIVGKALVCFTSTGRITLRASSFTSSGICTVPPLTSEFTITQTPRYTFAKESSDKARFSLKYSERYQSGSVHFTTNLEYNIVMTFTSPTEGTYNGTENSRDIYGTFTLY